MLTIRKKDDIIIPFIKQTGEEGWQAKTRIILEAIAEKWNSELPQPKAEEETVRLEAELQTSLPSSLKIFYQEFGVADIGETLQEWDDIKWLAGFWAAIPQLGPDLTEADQSVCPYLVTFGGCVNDSGIWCFHAETKEIYYFDYDERPHITKLYDSFDDYLKNCLILAQSELFANPATKKDVLRWGKEILEDMLSQS
ncbi:MAG: SMI1/KNR4 family protein [Syntrophomonadaceae bacterium]|jgi:hypothetical protein|nr:SMI1/KNR4 family protein [Syntrophomonadaceae bacterium]